MTAATLALPNHDAATPSVVPSSLAIDDPAARFPALFRDEIFQIETPRLWLRWPVVADLADIAAYASNKRVADMTAVIPHPYTREDAERHVREARETNAAGRGIVVAVVLKAAHRVIGGHSLRLREAWPTLGYALGPQAWGQGYATEAARALISTAFRFAHFEAFYATALPSNAASRRVLDKLGFVHVGAATSERPARGDRVAVESYALSRAAWLARQGFAAGVPWGAWAQGGVESRRSEHEQPRETMAGAS